RDHLLAVPGLARPVPLHDDEGELLHSLVGRAPAAAGQAFAPAAGSERPPSLVGREPAAAGQALAPAADRVAAFGRPGIDNLVLIMSAPRTPHALTPQPLVEPRTVDARCCGRQTGRAQARGTTSV